MAGLMLFTYPDSSACYRVRIALELKSLSWTAAPIDLQAGEGQNWEPAYMAINPQGLVPTLVDGERRFTQSLAIMEYLDDFYPEPPLLPGDARDRAHVRALAQMIASDVHPLDSLRVLRFLEKELGADQAQRDLWYRHWIEEGLKAVERMLRDSTQSGAFCHGDTPTMADACLVPQVYNARKYACDLTECKTVRSIYHNCMKIPAFQLAAPENQKDRELDQKTDVLNR